MTSPVTTQAGPGPAAGPGGALSRYRDELRSVMDEAARTPSPQAGFEPAWTLPPASPALDAFFAPSTIAAHRLSPTPAPASACCT